MRKQNIALWLLTLVILGMTQCRHENTEVYNEAGYQRDVATVPVEEKIYCNATVEDDFDGSSVLVVMDKKTGGINKPHKMSYFGSFEMEYIIDLTEITGDIDSKEYLNKEEFNQILMIKLPKDSKENVLDVIKQLEKVEGILYASPNYYLYPAATHPNDTLYGGTSPTIGQRALKGTYGINAPATWDITTGAKGINVGIIDSGIATHDDLNANLLPGWNYVNNTSNTDDNEGHGTRIAGIVGAVGHNNTGIAGVCWEVSLVPLKIYPSTNTQPGALESRAIQAITFAKNENIGILNFSIDPAFGYPIHSLTINTFQALYSAIDSYSGLFVQAAGNDGGNFNISGNVHTHLYYEGLRRRRVIISGVEHTEERDNVIIVGAINSSGNLWVNSSEGSNYGDSIVHLFAPGGDIESTYRWGGYNTDSGTSYAAPHVAGVAALIKSVHPDLTTLQIKWTILNNIGASLVPYNYSSSGGRLNAYNALTTQGAVVGFMDLKYNNSGVYEKIGRFYLFINGKWKFVERGFRRDPQTTPNLVSYPLANKLQMDPVPVAVGNFLGSRVINTPIEVMIPANNSSLGNHYGGITVNIKITSSGVTITDGNYIRTIGANAYLCHIFKIANKVGTL